MSAQVINTHVSFELAQIQPLSRVHSRINIINRTTSRSKYGELSHLELVKVCGESSQHPAWEEFHHRFDKLIKVYVRKAWKTRMMNGDMSNPVVQDILNDMAQDVYVKLLEDNQQALRNFKGHNDTSFMAYLTRISINIVAEYFRKQLAEKRKGQTVSMELLLDENTGDQISRALCHEFLCSNELDVFEQVAINQIITMLDESLKGQHFLRDKRIFQLYVDGFTSQQITSLIGEEIRVSTVDAIIRRVRRKLKGVLETRPAALCLAA